MMHGQKNIKYRVVRGQGLEVAK